MLNDLDSKADKTQTKLDAVNDRMKDALTKINDKSSNFCVYIICIVMLLGLATGLMVFWCARELFGWAGGVIALRAFVFRAF